MPTSPVDPGSRGFGQPEVPLRPVHLFGRQQGRPAHRQLQIVNNLQFLLSY
jgi:hypothetical protein